MIYRLTVYGYDSGMNQLLHGMTFDYRKNRVYNRVKNQNDELCCKAIRITSRSLRGVVIEKPIIIHYKFFCKDKRKDRLNIASAFDKSFEDALQKCKKMKNDGWNNVLNVTYDFAIDKLNPRVEVAIEEVNGLDIADNFKW